MRITTDHQPPEGSTFLHLPHWRRLQAKIWRWTPNGVEPVRSQRLAHGKVTPERFLNPDDGEQENAKSKNSDRIHSHNNNNKQRKSFMDFSGTGFPYCKLNSISFAALRFDLASSITLVALCWALLPACLRAVSSRSLTSRSERHEVSVIHRHFRRNGIRRVLCPLCGYWSRIETNIS